MSVNSPTDSYTYCIGNGLTKPPGRWPNEFGDSPTGSDGKARKIGISFRGFGQVGEGGDGRGGGEPGGYKDAMKQVRMLYSNLKTMSDSQGYSRKREVRDTGGREEGRGGERSAQRKNCVQALITNNPFQCSLHSRPGYPP